MREKEENLRRMKKMFHVYVVIGDMPHPPYEGTFSLPAGRGRDQFDIS